MSALGRRERRDDHDRNGQSIRPETAQNIDPAEARHCQIEGHDVRVQRSAGLQSLVAVSDRRDHFEAVPFQRVGEQSPHEGRVVGDDNAELHSASPQQPTEESS